MLYIKDSGTTYYQRNREVILNRAKYYYENNKELSREREQKVNIENYLKKKKILRESMEKTDIIICLKKKKQRLKEYQKNYREAKKHISQMQIYQ